MCRDLFIVCGEEMCVEFKKIKKKREMNEIETFQGKIKGKTKTKSTWNNYQLVIKG